MSIDEDVHNPILELLIANIANSSLWKHPQYVYMYYIHMHNVYQGCACICPNYLLLLFIFLGEFK